MKNEIVVIGGGEFAHLIIDVIKRIDQYEILGYTDLINKGSILGTKYLGTDEMLKELGFELLTVISNKAIIQEDVTIGEGTFVLDNALINAGTTIGKGCII